MPVDPVLLVRRLTDEPDDSTYTDAEITDRLTDAASAVNPQNVVALGIWKEKLAALSTLVDISEGGSQRKNSQAYANAKDMVEYFTGAVTDDNQSTTTIRRIVRT